MLLRGGGLEALRLVDGEVAGQPHESVPALRGIAHGGVVRVVLRFEQLLAEAGQVLCGGLELRAALRKTALTVGDLLPVFVKALFRRDELAGGAGGGQRTEDGDGLLLPDRREPQEAHFLVRLERGEELFVHAAEVQLEALRLQFLDLGGGEAAPAGERVARADRGGALGFQCLFALQTCVELVIELLEFHVVERFRFDLAHPLLLEHSDEPRERGEALQIGLVGIRLFREMDDAERTQRVEQLRFLRLRGDDVNDLHFLDHRAASCSFFLAILPRTTAEVCWSPR